MTAGKLASISPAATTNTLLYRCPIDKATSAILNVVNTNSTAQSYRAAVRDYDQVLTLDSASYNLIRGNVLTGYKVTVSPGLSATESLTPGDFVTTEDKLTTFKYFDVVKPTSTITIPVKIAGLGDLNLASSTGVFDDGDTVTGVTTGLTATVYRYSTLPLSMKVSIAGINNSATSFRVSDSSLVATNDYLFFADGNELVQISGITGYSVTVTRAQLGTTASSHNAGVPLIVARPTATTSTLSAAITSTTSTSLDLTSATGFTVGSYILIDTEILKITNIATNTLTVTRGQLGTTAATHLSAATVTQHTDQGYVSFNYFKSGETVGNGTETAVVATYNSNTDNYTYNDVFVYDIDGDTNFSYPSSLTYNVDRTYRFTQVDSSNTGHPLRFSSREDGTNYSTGVTIAGTPGSSGSYTEIVIDADTSGTLYTKCDSHSGEGLSGIVDIDPLYTQIYVYDVDGTFTPSTSSFQTTSGLNTVVSVSTGPYGYVHKASGATVKVSLGNNSTAFTNTVTFYDSPKTTNAVRSIATVSSTTAVTDVNSEDYVFYGKAINANTTDPNTGIVVGPGQSIVVYSSATSINYVLNGFEDATNDFSPVLYIREVTTGGGGGI
jgi:hypothetical protein